MITDADTATENALCILESRFERQAAKTIRTQSAARTRRPGPNRWTAERRHELIASAAYRLAEQRGFAPGHETEDWLRAEAEIDAAGASFL